MVLGPGTSKAAHEEEFLSLVSHELRTPLSIIKWYTEMLLDEDCGTLNDEQKKYLKTIQSSNTRAIGLIRSILNVSRLNLGTFSITPVEVDLRAITKQALTDLAVLHESKHLKIHESYEGAVPGMIGTLLADKQVCLVLVRTLIENAIAFSHDEGEVTISVSEKAGGDTLGNHTLSHESFVIMVKDSGIGIPEGEQAQVFGRFFKATNTQETGSSGSGLGLYTVKTILDTVGGEIWFESIRGEGSSFFIALPKSGMAQKSGKVSFD